jgi:peptidoglycan/LPS O-acetylase OafA/YrhL
METNAYVASTNSSRSNEGVRLRALTPLASAHLDLTRALAARAVMWGHVRGLFCVDFQELPHAGLILKAFYFFTGFGHQAVMVFFVLSGFLISSAIISRRTSGIWSWRDYAIDRASRLYVVLVPGLVVGLFWDMVGSHIFVSTGIYSHPLQEFGLAIPQNQLTAGVFFGNLLFLQTIVCSTFGSNGPLWSLANEFWYYVLFPVALTAGIAWARKSARSAIPFSILAIFVAFFVGRGILLGFLVWFAGTVLVFAYSNYRFRRRSSLTLYAVTSLLALSLCLVASRIEHWPLLGGDLAVGVTFSLVLFAVLQIEMGADNRYYARIAHFLAGFSYSLYVLHFPLLLFLRSWLVPGQKWQPDPIHLFYAAIVGSFALSFAWLVSTFTEGKTRVVRNWLKSVVPLLDGRSARRQLAD